MAAFTSKATGNWATAGQTTWNEVGTPGAGDTVSIGAHTITVSANTIIGTSPNDTTTMAVTYSAAGTLTISAGFSLTVRGNMQMINSAVLTIGAGSTVTFDNAASGGSPVYAITNAGFSIYNFNGTTGAHATFGAIAGQTMTLSGAAWAAVTATFCDFVRFSGFTISSTSGNISLTDCTFTSCDQIRFISTSTTTNFIMRRCVISSGTAALNDLNLSYGTAAVSGTREISNCVITRVFVNSSKSFAIFNNYFGNGLDFTSAATWSYFRNNFVKQDGARNTGNGQLLPVSVERNYFVVDNATGNPHFTAPTALFAVDGGLKQCVFEAHTADLIDFGDCVIVNVAATSGGTKILCTNNLVLQNSYPSVTVGSGTLLTMFVADANALSDWERNTANVDDSATAVGKRGMFAFAEGGTGFAGQVGVVKGNLAWGRSASQGYLAERVTGNVKDIVTAAGADYNWTYNISTGDNLRGYEDRAASNTIWTAGTAVAASVDTHQGTGDPQFVDSTRNVEKWAVARGYGTTYATGLTALQASPSRVIDLIAYVFEGFKVKNASCRNAAHDGGAVGAANYHKATRVLGNVNGLGVYLQAKYTITGASTNAATDLNTKVSVFLNNTTDLTTKVIANLATRTGEMTARLLALISASS